MKRKIVVMALIPGGIRRGPPMRSDLSYAKYARATWAWWCDRHDADFVAIEAAPPDPAYARMPPTLQRWAVLDRLLEERGESSQALLVDADTMIRWDTPDIFALARGFSAVADSGPPIWILESTKAFQPLFPGTSLVWWEYFNSGLIVLGHAQRRFIRVYLDYCAENWPELEKVIGSGNFGTEQTALNFMTKREKEPVFLLPRPFNYVNCFPMAEELARFDRTATGDPADFAAKAFAHPRTFDFVKLGYVWHFTNVVTYRALVMGETWRRVQGNYPGAAVPDA